MENVPTKQSVKISIVTPTIRKSGLEINQKALKRQSFKDFEWLIGSSFDPQIPEARWIKDDFKGGFWTLNRIYNKLVKEAKADLIVSLQDNIWVEKDGLEKMYSCQIATGALISGVGDQYEKVDKRGRPEVLIWSDPRKTTKFGSFYECMWNDNEFNWCIFPRSLYNAVGGMDEKLDFLGYGGDQLQLCNRLNDYGAHFYLDQTNESRTLRHGRDDFGGQEHWDKNHVLFNGEYEKRKEQLIGDGLWPVLQTNTKSVIRKAGDKYASSKNT